MKNLRQFKPRIWNVPAFAALMPALGSRIERAGADIDPAHQAYVIHNGATVTAAGIDRLIDSGAEDHQANASALLMKQGQAYTDGMRFEEAVPQIAPHEVAAGQGHGGPGVARRRSARGGMKVREDIAARQVVTGE